MLRPPSVVALVALLAACGGCSGPGGFTLDRTPGSTALALWWSPATGEAIAATPADVPPGMVPLELVAEPEPAPGVWADLPPLPALAPLPIRFRGCRVAPPGPCPGTGEAPVLR